MLLEFSVANFRSIHKKCTLSMVAQAINDDPATNIAIIDKNKILKTAAIYGANSSGKTNIVRAMTEMKRNILFSVKLNDDEGLSYDPFLLTTAKKIKPSFFEAIFIINGYKYRYGFEITSEIIAGEWLFRSKPNSKLEKTLFIRTQKGIGVDENNFPDGIGKEENTNDNRLFLSLCAQLGGIEAKEVLGWFNTGYNVISGIDSKSYVSVSEIMFHKNLDGCENAKEFFKTLQLGFKDIETKVIQFSPEKISEDIPDNVRKEILKNLNGTIKINLQSKHFIYDKNGKVAAIKAFDIEEMESDGTKKLIQLSGPIFNTLKTGKLLVVDELDAKMHPLISQYIIHLFNNPKTNPLNAQLIFTTHDTHLLSSKLLRRDQIWFTEKDTTEQTDLYNMMDIVLPDGSKPRNDANYEKNYIAGRYGAIPYIQNE